MKRIKNADTVEHVWLGQVIEVGQYFTIPQSDETKWANDSTLLTAIANSMAVVSDGTNDIADIATAINYLTDNTVKPVEIRATPSYGAKTVTLANGAIKKLYARNTGVGFTLTAGSNELLYTAAYPWVKLTGVECIGCEAGDYVDFKVFDTAAGTYSGVPNYLLNQFAFGLRLPKDFYARSSTFDADMYQGMVIKMTYTSISAKTIGFNILMDEVK